MDIEKLQTGKTGSTQEQLLARILKALEKSNSQAPTVLAKTKRPKRGILAKILGRK